MRRPVFSGPWGSLSALSLLLWITFAVVWVVSCARPTDPSRGLTLGRVSVAARHGRLLFTRDADQPGADADLLSPPFVLWGVTRRPAPDLAATRPAENMAVLLVGEPVAESPTWSAGTVAPARPPSSVATLSPGTTGVSVGTITPAAPPNSVGTFLPQAAPSAAASIAPSRAPTVGVAGAASGGLAAPGLPIRTVVLFPGVNVTRQQYTTLGAGAPGVAPVRWVDIGLGLPFLVTAVLPLLAAARAARNARDRHLGARHGVEEPFVRVGRGGPARPCGLGQGLIGGLVTALALLSLALLIALLAAWAYSYRPGGWTYDCGPYPDDSLNLSLVDGTALGSRSRSHPAPGPQVYHEHYVLYMTCGVSTHTGTPYDAWSLRTPLWLAAAVAALLPLGWSMRRLRGRLLRKRVREGLCPACGYDLRETRGRCPECGAIALHA